jgi:hypothetical protein
MPSTTAMTHRATIERDSNRGTASDAYGHDAAPSWSTLRSEVNCRYWFEEGSTRTQVGEAVALTMRKLMVPTDTVVHEDDRILSVKDRRGRIIADGPMKIDSIGRRADHLLLMLTDVR